MKLSYEVLAIELDKIFQVTLGKIIAEKREATDQEVHDFCLRTELMIEAAGWTVQEYTLRLLSAVDNGWDNNFPYPTTSKPAD
jgi:hypothetical protein